MAGHKKLHLAEGKQRQPKRQPIANIGTGAAEANPIRIGKCGDQSIGANKQNDWMQAEARAIREPRDQQRDISEKSEEQPFGCAESERRHRISLYTEACAAVLRGAKKRAKAATAPP